MGISSNLGFPRMGVHRELKKALEAHWAGKLDESGLLAVSKVLKLNHWVLQQQLGILVDTFFEGLGVKSPCRCESSGGRTPPRPSSRPGTVRRSIENHRPKYAIVLGRH